MLRDAVSACPEHVVSGSLIQWGDEWLSTFDLVVFLHVPAEIRMKRLVSREIERYGDKIYTDPVRQELFKDFYDWAVRYDDESFTGRNIKIHKDWLQAVSCPVIEIYGDTTVAERIKIVLAGNPGKFPPQTPQ